jgi:putative FmdB family regulatory protein
MPTYDYNCKKCGPFQVIESIKTHKMDLKCQCGLMAERTIIFSNQQFIGTKVQHAEYNPGLGVVTKNKQHREEIAKRKGLEEVGNEKPSTIHKETKRTLDDKLSWKDIEADLRKA